MTLRTFPVAIGSLELTARDAAWAAAAAARDAAWAAQVAELRRLCECVDAGVDPYPEEAL